MYYSSLSRFKDICKRMRARGMSIVFTNGCFDIIHYGHVRILREARALGDALVVGLNSDKSIERLKSRKPFNDLRSRKTILSEFKSIDYIISFNELTPIKIIRAISPNVLVKGGDYAPDDVVGAREVKDRNGKIVILPFYNGYSSTAIIEKLRSTSVQN